MSETAKTRQLTAFYCGGNGIDLGSGGDPVVPWAIQFDQLRKAHLSDLPIQWVGDVFAGLPFKDETLDFVYASHLLEDVADWWKPLIEWTRVLRQYGHIIIQVPDKERFRAAVAAGQDDNLAHKHESHVGELSGYFNCVIIKGPWNILHDHFEPADSYNILFVAQKL